MTDDSLSVMSVTLHTCALPDVLLLIREYLVGNQLRQIATVNPEFVMAAQSDLEFRAILNHLDLNVVDGIGLELAIRMLHRRQCQRITGVALTWELARIASELGKSIYLLGAAEGVACAAARAMKSVYSSLHIAGAYAGRPDEPDIVNRINSCAPDILLVAFGSPRQEKFIFRNRDRLCAKVAMGVGGTFDYLAGTVPYAPSWVREAGFEWLYRLVKQPERLPRVITATVRFPLAVAVSPLLPRVM